MGNAYDGTNFAQLPFRADLVVYVKDSYNEYRTPNGSNGWNTQVSNTLSYSSTNGTVMEVAIPWSVIGEGRVHSTSSVIKPAVEVLFMHNNLHPTLGHYRNFSEIFILLYGFLNYRWFFHQAIQQDELCV